jgi:uncharacterized protein (DUF302 family)
MTQSLGFEVTLKESYEAAMERVAEALGKEGFGVLTRIDVRTTLREKLGEDFRPYSILGACNPVLAHQALSRNPEVGLLLPCNVTVEASGDGSVVRIVDPAVMLGAGALGEDPVMQAVAKEAEARLRRVAKTLEETD